MIGTIRRHQQWLWIVIIAATIISFLAYFRPSSRNGGGDQDSGGANLGSINGDSITLDQFRAAEAEGRIFFRLNYGEWPDSEDKKKDVARFAEQRLLLNAELEEYHIEVTSEAAARFTRQLLGIKPGDNVPADKILDTLTKLAHDGGVTLDDFDRFARHQAGQEYLVALVGMTGKLITPKEAEVFYRRENEPMLTELVSFPATNFYAKTVPTEKDIEDYYTKMQADYRVPDRIEVNYVTFAASNYFGQAEKQLGTNINEHVDQEYLQAGPDAFKDSSGKQLSPPEAKAKLKKQLLLYVALTEARKDANSFMNELANGHDEQHPFTRGDLATQAKTRNMTVQTTAPFSMKDTPKELPVPAKMLRMLFTLRDDDPDDKDRSEIYAGSPLIGDEAVYVCGLEKRIPSEIQPLSAVHDKVVSDYRKGKAIELATEAGKKFESSLQAGLAQGKTFDTMCAALFVRVQTLTPFSLSSTSIPELPDKSEFEQVMDIAGRMQPGQYSPFVPTMDGGLVLYVKAHMPVDQSAMQRELPQYVTRMRERFQIAAFNAWFNRQYQLKFVAGPAALALTGS